MPQPSNPQHVSDGKQRDPRTGEPVAVPPLGDKTEGEIDADRHVEKDDALRIDPDSRIPRPVPPDLA